MVLGGKNATASLGLYREKWRVLRRAHRLGFKTRFGRCKIRPGFLGEKREVYPPGHLQNLHPGLRRVWDWEEIVKIENPPKKPTAKKH